MRKLLDRGFACLVNITSEAADGAGQPAMKSHMEVRIKSLATLCWKGAFEWIKKSLFIIFRERQ